MNPPVFHTSMQLDLLPTFYETRLLITPATQITSNVISVQQKENTWISTLSDKTMAEFPKIVKSHCLK